MLQLPLQKQRAYLNRGSQLSEGLKALQHLARTLNQYI